MINPVFAFEKTEPNIIALKYILNILKKSIFH